MITSTQIYRQSNNYPSNLRIEIVALWMGQTSDRALSSRKIFDMDRCLETISDFMFGYIGAQRLNNKFQTVV